MPSPWRRKFSLGMAFPLLAAYESAGWLDGLSFDLDKPLADVVADPDRRGEVEREISSALLPADGEDTFAAASPGIFRLLDDALPYDRLGTRAANIFLSRRFRTWRDVAHLTPTDVMSFDNFGETSLRQVADSAVRDAIDALLQAEPPVETELLPAELFRRTSSQRLLEEPALIHQVGSGEHTIGDLAPELRTFQSDDPLPAELLPVRLKHRLPVTTWGQLLDVRPRDLLAMANVGATTVGELLAALRRAVDEFVPSATASAPPGAPLLVSTIDAVASWAVAERDLNELGDFLQLVEGTELPPRLRRRWLRLSSARLEALSPKPLDIGALVSELLDRVEPRLRRILRDRVWPSPVRATLEELGEHLGMTRERVRQIESRGVSELRGLLEEEHFAPIFDRAFDLRRRLGAAVPLDSSEFTNAKRSSVRDIEPHDKGDGWDLLLWLAGPYRQSDGWLVVRADGPDPKGAELRKRAESSGFVSDETVTSVLDEAGVRPEWHEAWIERCGGFRAVEGGLLDATGGILDQALRYLEFRGVPLTIEEILEATGRTDASVRSVRQRLFEHQRVARVSKTEVGLREWGGEEFTTIPDEMAEEIERAGGSLVLDALVERLVEAFGVSPTSVRMYAGRPMFIIDQDGSVRVRGADDEPYELRDDLSTVAGCYELSPTTAAWRVRVDRDVLRGSGRHIPEQLAGWLRLRPGSTLTLNNVIHPLPLSWRPWSQPDVGSLKSFADALGAAMGDWLVLVFDRTGTVEVRLVNDDLDDPLQRFAAMVGIEPTSSDRDETLLRLAVAFGVDASDIDSLPFRLRRTVDVRKDIDITELAEEALLG